jgi:hypothetical protein
MHLSEKYIVLKKYKDVVLVAKSSIFREDTVHLIAKSVTNLQNIHKRKISYSCVFSIYRINNNKFYFDYNKFLAVTHTSLINLPIKLYSNIHVLLLYIFDFINVKLL